MVHSWLLAADAVPDLTWQNWSLGAILAYMLIRDVLSPLLDKVVRPLIERVTGKKQDEEDRRVTAEQCMMHRKDLEQLIKSHSQLEEKFVKGMGDLDVKISQSCIALEIRLNRHIEHDDGKYAELLKSLVEVQRQLAGFVEGMVWVKKGLEDLSKKIDTLARVP